MRWEKAEKGLAAVWQAIERTAGLTKGELRGLCVLAPVYNNRALYSHACSNLFILSALREWQQAEQEEECRYIAGRRNEDDSSVSSDSLML